MSDAAQPAATERPWDRLPDGEYAIVELFGHTTLVGKIDEVERFGAKLMAMRPLFKGALLDPIYHGGAAIYRLTPCSKSVAWERAPSESYQLPTALRCVLPVELLPGPGETIDHEEEDDAGED